MLDRKKCQCLAAEGSMELIYSENWNKNMSNDAPSGREECVGCKIAGKMELSLS